MYFCLHTISNFQIIKVLTPYKQSNSLMCKATSGASSIPVKMNELFRLKSINVFVHKSHSVNDSCWFITGNLPQPHQSAIYWNTQLKDCQTEFISLTKLNNYFSSANFSWGLQTNCSLMVAPPLITSRAIVNIF